MIKKLTKHTKAPEAMKAARAKHRKGLKTVVSQIQLPEPQASEVLADIEKLLEKHETKTAAIISAIRNAAKNMRRKKRVK